jgi:hypothetical protein
MYNSSTVVVVVCHQFRVVRYARTTNSGNRVLICNWYYNGTTSTTGSYRTCTSSMMVPPLDDRACNNTTALRFGPQRTMGIVRGALGLAAVTTLLGVAVVSFPAVTAAGDESFAPHRQLQSSRSRSSSRSPPPPPSTHRPGGEERSSATSSSSRRRSGGVTTGSARTLAACGPLTLTQASM